jgi:hypothetical protein
VLRFAFRRKKSSGSRSRSPFASPLWIVGVLAFLGNWIYELWRHGIIFIAD